MSLSGLPTRYVYEKKNHVGPLFCFDVTKEKDKQTNTCEQTDNAIIYSERDYT